jgi:hypothetical protein
MQAFSQLARSIFLQGKNQKKRPLVREWTIQGTAFGMGRGISAIGRNEPKKDNGVGSNFPESRNTLGNVASTAWRASGRHVNRVESPQNSKGLPWLDTLIGSDPINEF